MARKRLITVEEAILLHLLDNSRYSPEDTAPMDLAQAGISRALGVRRSHISMSLDVAKSKDNVEEHLARVKGESRRRKCYYLTIQGKESAPNLKVNIGSEKISARLPDSTHFEGSLSELQEKTGFSLPRLALLVSDGTLKLPAVKKAASEIKVPEIENFVGREKEIEEMKNFFSGNAKILILNGMPGIGKTALVASAAKDLDIFWFDITEWSSTRNLANHLAGFLSRHGKTRMERYLEAREIPDIADLRDILLDLDFSLTMIFDDCQNASTSLGSLLRMMASASGDSENLKVGFLGRDIPDIMNFKQKLTDERTIQMTLAPLNDEDSNELLRGRGIDELALSRIVQQAGGNPLYLKLVGTGIDTPGEDIEDMLARMIYHNLSDRENELLHLLSVFRHPADSDALVEDSEDIVTLENLEKKCIIFNAGGWNMHNLVRDFYYSRQAPGERESRHEQVAEFYNAHSSGPDDEVEETFHLLKARDFESGTMNFITGGQQWLSQGFVDEILYLADMLPDNYNNPEEEYNINFLIASAFDLIGDWDRASEYYGICFELATKLKDIDKEAAILRREGAILYRKGELADARNIFKKALDLLSDSTNQNLLAEIHGGLGVVHWRLGKSKNAREAHETDLEISNSGKDKSGIARALNNLGILDWESGDYGTALERYSRALELAEKLGDKKLVAILYSNIADVHRSKGENVEARRYYERCLELAEYMKFNWQVAEAYRGLAQVHGEKRTQYLQKSLAIFQQLGAEEDVKSIKEMMQ